MITGSPASQNWEKKSPLAPPPPKEKQKPDKRPT